MKRSLTGSAAALAILAAMALSPANVRAQTKPAAKTSTHRAATHPSVAHHSLLNPASCNEKAPAAFKAKFVTTQGDFVVEVTRAWSPLGADRFYNLVKDGFFTDVEFFRVVPGFVVQFGISGNPKIAKAWSNAAIADEPVLQSNKPGYLTYAKGGPNTRTTQVFINFGDNSALDAQGFPPFGQVVEGMDVVNKLYGGYGEQVTNLQGEIEEKGNAFLKAQFPKLDSIKSAVIVPAAPAAAAAKKPAAAAKKPAAATKKPAGATPPK
ncbi:MAG TPA: peptidylprolyl isomerase [Terriglobia bacterium]|nr:peptidylprolyl isomerase [Terriglobia bacterium]